MKQNWIFVISLVLSLYFDAPVEAKRLFLRPLSGDEVYQVLRDAGREDAIPQGRVITQGIAAVTGFGLGVLKGIGGSILFDLAMSNETQQYFSNMMGSWSGNSGSTTSVVASQPQEICFNSRSLNDIDDNEYDDDYNDVESYDAISKQADNFPTSTNIKPDYISSTDEKLPSSDLILLASTPPEGAGRATNCIVINTPTGRKRRRRSVNLLDEHSGKSRTMRDI